MYKIGVICTALFALAVAGIAQSSVGDDWGGGDRLYGGGQILFLDGSTTRDFSVDAHAGDSTRVGTLNYGTAPRKVTCLRVRGSTGVIGGFFEGSPFVQYFEDNGPAYPAGLDRATPVVVIGTSEEAALMPARFPRVCPAPTPPDPLASTLASLDAGDVAVVDAP